MSILTQKQYRNILFSGIGIHWEKVNPKNTPDNTGILFKRVDLKKII